MFKDLVTKVFIVLTKTQIAQKILEFIVRNSQILMGIGSGGKVFSSGEKIVFHILKKQIHEPYMIFDVGTNDGQYLSIIQKYLRNCNYYVHCFEPNSYSMEKLKEITKSEKNISLNKIGISNYKGTGSLWFNYQGSQLASLTKRDLDHRDINFGLSEEIQVLTIDEYCKENDINHIHLLKIDIEGNEYKALQGANKLLCNEAIDLISFEFGASNIDSRYYFKDFWHFFKRMNMNLFRITPSGLLVKIYKYNEIYEQFRPTNYLASSRRISVS